MHRLLTLFRTRLALRTAAIILVIVGLLGVAFLALAVHIRAASEQRTQQSRLEELLSTVERTTQIACFLGDRQLAKEVTDGLLRNRIVREVRIVQNDGTVLANSRSESGGLGGAMIARAIDSPFESGEQLCRMSLTPDQDRIDGMVASASKFLAVALLLQLAGIGVCVVLVVVRFVTRPITGISHRLHELEAETGHKLQAPRGNHYDEIGQLVASVNAMIDHLVSSLSEERRLRLEREVEERRYRTIFDNVEAGIFELDGEGRVIAANPAFRRLFLLTEELDLSSRRIALGELATEGGPAPEELAVRDMAQESARQWEMALGNGAFKRWVSVLLSRLEEGRLQGVAHDITERKQATDAAEQLAMTDPLTGLGNRLGFERRLAVAATHHRLCPQNRCALVMLDFDHFKRINDTWGHQAGDQVLRHVAELLAEVVRQRDYLARLGGDEFVVLLEDFKRDSVTPLLERFVELLNQPIALKDTVQIQIGASIGIAILGEDTDDIQQAVQFADMAMYRAKRAGRNTWRFHEEPPLSLD